MKKRIVQMSCLGQFGGLGNQIFQYAFGKKFAQLADAEFRHPRWIFGETLFNNIEITPPLVEGIASLPLDFVPRVDDDFEIIDLFGYFQNSEHLSFLREEELREWFELHKVFLPMIKSLRGEQKVTVHIRRGDYLKAQNVFCSISLNCYLRFLDEIGFLKKRLHFVEQKSSDPRDAIVDFLTLMSSKYLVRANSTFSLWAGFLGNNQVYSPCVEDKVGWSEDVSFVKGNFPPICRTTSSFPFGRS